APHELEHEARGVPHRVRHVAEGDQLGLLAVAPAVAHLHGHASILQALSNGPARVQTSLLLLALAQRERVLDLASEARHHRLHLRDLVGRQREERLVGEDLAGELLALAEGAALELALHVLADHAPEGPEAGVAGVADPRRLTRLR